MNKTTYYIISVILYGTIIVGGRLWLGLNFIERIIALVIVGGLFEVIYQKIKIRWATLLSTCLPHLFKLQDMYRFNTNDFIIRIPLFIIFFLVWPIEGDWTFTRPRVDNWYCLLDAIFKPRGMGNSNWILGDNNWLIFFD